LVPTCWWTKDSAGDVVQPVLGDDGITCVLPVATSYTNIEDLRAYVVSNLRAFKVSGGCALLLETIIRIHGKGAVARMIRRSRKASNCGSTLGEPLICCTCDARHLSKLEADPTLSQKLKLDAKNRVVFSTTPGGHGCLSLELLSLILTGQVHSTLQGWSAAPLGLGILSDKPNEVGRGLTRPEKPVWILRGPTCYSVMWLNGSNDHAKSFSRINHPGAVASLTHWNCWYGERNATNLRLVTDRSERSTAKAVSDDEVAIFEKDMQMLTTTLKMVARRRRENLAAINECVSVETVPPECIVTQSEMDRIIVNADDQHFYPGKYRMWRYDLGEDPLGLPATAERKFHAQSWRPFFSLSKREQLLVESKLGPKICTALWTRWPHATVDQLVPDEPPPVV
jgi:hypothetical protein